jgi:hypothetical protein
MVFLFSSLVVDFLVTLLEIIGEFVVCPGVLETEGKLVL